MRPLVKKMSKFGILKLQMIVSAVVMVAAIVMLPAAIIAADPSLILNPYVLGVVVIGVLMLGFYLYFISLRPYLIYRRSPEVLAETDGEFVYIYGKKQAKIPLSAFEGAVVTYHLPFIYSNELVAVLLVHFFSDKYGDLSIDVPGYGSYRLCFVAKVMETADSLTRFLCETSDITEKV